MQPPLPSAYPRTVGVVGVLWWVRLPLRSGVQLQPSSIAAPGPAMPPAVSYLVTESAGTPPTTLKKGRVGLPPAGHGLGTTWPRVGHGLGNMIGPRPHAATWWDPKHATCRVEGPSTKSGLYIHPWMCHHGKQSDYVCASITLSYMTLEWFETHKVVIQRESLVQTIAFLFS